MLSISNHFELIRLADGVYAAIGNEDNGAAYSNAGIIDLGDRTLIFDAFMLPAAARDLKAAAQELTTRSTMDVIISHPHSDHWGGTQVFDHGTTILASHTCREVMLEWMQEITRFKEDPSEILADIEANEERLKTETDPRWRTSLVKAITGARRELEALPSLNPRLPNQTFEGRMVFYGTQRRAELVALAQAHSESDAYLFLPQEGILFLGDLGFFKSQPYMVYCNPHTWATHLEAFEKSDAKMFIPGHGPLGTTQDLALQRQYMTILLEMIKKVIQQHGSVDEVLSQPLPPPFDSWLMGEMFFFERNVQAMYRRLTT